MLRVATSECPICTMDEHGLARCPKFLAADASCRHKMVKDARRCTNCLGTHSRSQCQSSFMCRTCNKKHHTSLHRDNAEQSKTTALVAASKQPTTSKPHLVPDGAPKAGLLPSALVVVENGPRIRKGRIAFNLGSGVSLMTDALASNLRLKRYPHNLVVDGIVRDGRVRSYVIASLQLLHDPKDAITLSFCVVPKIPATHPPRSPEVILHDPVVKSLRQYADPQLGGSLDALIGSLNIHKCTIGNPVKSANQIVATPTLFGWTIIGPADHGKPQPVFNFQTKEDSLHQSLERLWKMDQIPETAQLKDEDQLAMEHFADTHKVDEGGRYVVKLPRVPEPPELGESRQMAIKRFEQNERSLRRKGLLNQFEDVVNEYIELDHAEPVPSVEISHPKEPVFYMPIQGVVKESSTTTKMRAVFDASAKSSTGVALNELLLAGPTLHPMLPDILLKFRQHKIACTADVGKMFREISLHPDVRDLHRFLRRRKVGQLEDCRMKRVTFGVRSSPFLTTHVIRALAEEHDNTHSLASQAVQTCFYVDDFMSGAESVEKADVLRQQLWSLFSLTGMNLRKWRSNSQDLRDTIPPDLLETTDLNLPAPLSSPKALGMYWDVSQDNLHVAVPSPTQDANVTKRQVASQSAQVYDVL